MYFIRREVSIVPISLGIVNRRTKQSIDRFDRLDRRESRGYARFGSGHCSDLPTVRDVSRQDPPSVAAGGGSLFVDG